MVRFSGPAPAAGVSGATGSGTKPGIPAMLPARASAPEAVVVAVVVARPGVLGRLSSATVGSGGARRCAAGLAGASPVRRVLSRAAEVPEEDCLKDDSF